MVEHSRKPSGTPDPHALRIARAVQSSVKPDIVILFGSRAAGDHREDSDIDILVVTDGANRLSAETKASEAARTSMRENPPRLELAIISMDRRTLMPNQAVAAYLVNHSSITTLQRGRRS